MELIPEETIRELRNNLPLLRLVISRRTQIDDLGWALCPFHQEKTKSFHTFFGVDRARFHCFGCGATGDIFNYLKRADNIDFKLAVIKLKYIIKNSGVTLLSTELAEPAKLDAVKLDTIKLNQANNPSNCYLNCINYLKLEELYREVWEENQKFRVWLNLGEFKEGKRK
jgi:DNA primase